MQRACGRSTLAIEFARAETPPALLTICAAADARSGARHVGSHGLVHVPSALTPLGPKKGVIVALERNTRAGLVRRVSGARRVGAGMASRCDALCDEPGRTHSRVWVCNCFCASVQPGALVRLGQALSVGSHRSEFCSQQGGAVRRRGVVGREGEGATLCIIAARVGEMSMGTPRGAACS